MIDHVDLRNGCEGVHGEEWAGDPWPLDADMPLRSYGTGVPAHRSGRDEPLFLTRIGGTLIG